MVIRLIKNSTDLDVRAICLQNAVSKTLNVGVMNSTPETTTDGLPPTGEEKAIDIPGENPLPVSSASTELPTAPPFSGLDEKLYTKAVRRILSKPKRGKVLDPWALSTLRDKVAIAKIFNQETIAQVQLVDGLTVKQRLDAAIALGEAMLNGDEEGGKMNPELRLKGIGIIAGAAKVSGELSDQIIRIAEKAGIKAESGNGPKRKNLPPSTGFEVTIGEGENKVTARAVATNGQAPT